MKHPTTAREALMDEVIGDVAVMLRQVEAMASALGQTCDALGHADAQLRESLAGFESRMAAISERAKGRVVQHLAEHADKAARQSIEMQVQAMNQAARAAFSHALGDLLLYVLRQRDAPPPKRTSVRSAEWWLTHVAAAAAGSAATWLLVLQPSPI